MEKITLKQKLEEVPGIAKGWLGKLASVGVELVHPIEQVRTAYSARSSEPQKTETSDYDRFLDFVRSDFPEHAFIADEVQDMVEQGKLSRQAATEMLFVVAVQGTADYISAANLVRGQKSGIDSN